MISYTKVDAFKQCKKRYKFHYIDKLKALPECDYQSPLYLGNALHLGIESTTAEGINYYYNQYNIISDNAVNEAIKLEYLIPKAKENIENIKNGIFEFKLETEWFKGFIDLLIPVTDGIFDLYDFKYSNNVEYYEKSAQVHIYKYIFEKITGNKIRNLYYLMIPKVMIRLKYKNKTNLRNETLNEFRKRIIEELEKKEIVKVEINYDESKVIDFLKTAVDLEFEKEFNQNQSKLCDWCEYKNLCYKGDDIDMDLPINQKREIKQDSYKKIWVYGQPFSGKTYLANQFPNALMLNTDGNIKYVDSPYLAIRDEVTESGRLTNRKFAWETFKEIVEELEKHNNDFETIVVDLLEDVYDYCRIKICDEKGWEHESDDSFKAYDIVRSEFLRTLKRLLNLDYNIVLISHEDTSRDITKKSSDKITAIKPNIADKLAPKIAGMVDIVVRTVKDDDTYLLSFKNSDVVFGGGRLDIKSKDIESSYDSICEIYGGNCENKQEDKQQEEVKEEKQEEKQEELPKRRTRRTRKDD